jgi:hypothetical protein
MAGDSDMKMKIILGIAVMFLFFVVLSGNVSALITYQEDANATQCSGSWYDGIGYGCDKVYDADWNTFGLGIDPDNLGYYYANYTVPLYTTDAIWQTSTVNLTIFEPFPTPVIFNGTVPQECLSGDILQFRVISADFAYGSYWACWNYTSSDWTSRSGGAFSDINSCGQSFDCGIYGYAYEEGVFWEIAPPPLITIQSPMNTTYGTTNIWFNATASSDADTCIVDYGLGNVTLTNSTGNYNYNDTSVAQGTHTAIFYCNNTAGLWNSSMVTFTVDSIPPVIWIETPINSTYTNRSTWFNVSLNKAGDTCIVDYGYGNNTMTNSSGNWNYFNGSMADGNYLVKFFCNSTIGIMGFNSVHFAIDTTPPAIFVTNPFNITYIIPSVWFNVTSPDAVTCLVNYGFGGEIMTNSSGNWSYLNSSMVNGVYSVQFYCVDAYGNLNVTDPIIFTVNVPIPTPPIIDPSSITGQLVFTLGFGIMGLFAVLTLLGFGYLETTGKPDPETIAKIMIGVTIIILMIVAVWTGIVTPP